MELTRRSSRRERSLFYADQAALPFDAYSPSPEPRAAWIEEQLPLLEGRAPLIGDLELAVWDGDFAKARPLYEQLLETYPAERSSSELAFLAEVPDDLWGNGIADSDRLVIWRSIGKALGLGTARYRRARNGFFRRLLSTADPVSLTRAHPEATADIANSFYASGDASRGREAVREVLLGGNELRPLAFEDREVADLLGEDESAPWLASLGAIRFLWPRHAIRLEDVEALERELVLPLPEEDLAKALDFWKCLCVSARGARVSEELRRQARRRMKRLHEPFHQEYLEGKRY